MKKGLLSRGYVSLLATQFWGAANDNILKTILVLMVTQGLWADALGNGGQGWVGLCLTVPFIILSGYAGQFADRYSKQRIIVLMKILEIPIALIAGIGLWTGNLWITLFALVILATQSTFFGPAKYGVIPELVNDRDLSHANGAINMLTNIAIIFGTLIAGPVTDMFYPTQNGQHIPDGGPVSQLPDPVLWLPLIVMVVVAIVGIITSLLVPKLTPKDPTLKYDWNPFRTYIHTIREMKKGPLLWIALAWAFFYMIGMTALLILPAYKDLLPDASFTDATNLLGVLAVSVGVGSLAAGLISGKKIQPRLVPIGAIGMTVFFGALGIVNPTFWNTAILISGAGIFAGFYIIPLQALIQDLSPESERGRFLGTTNALAFVFSSLGSLTVVVAGSVFHMGPNRIFLICAAMGLIGLVLVYWRFRSILMSTVQHKQE